MGLRVLGWLVKVGMEIEDGAQKLELRRLTELGFLGFLDYVDGCLGWSYGDGDDGGCRVYG